MPHTPGHKYIIRDTGEEYRGRTTKRGDKLFTTTGGGYEGEFSLELIEQDVNNTMTPETNPTATMNEDVVTQFVIGEKRGNAFYHQTFSNQNYYYVNGNIVPKGTQLHHHTIPPNGRSNFMTQHTMDGNEQDVFPNRPDRSQRNRRNRRQLSRLGVRQASTVGRTNRGRTNRNGMTPSAGNARRRTVQQQRTPTQQPGTRRQAPRTMTNRGTQRRTQTRTGGRGGRMGGRSY